MKKDSWILATIVIAQFCCTSVWFASNSVLSEMAANFQLPQTALADLTSAVQFGFIAGTLIFAILTIADRFSPSKIFFICGLVVAGLNAGLILDSNHIASLLSLRFFTGFFLAGIYPIGMKIAADYYDKDLNKSLGYLVGALVLGTAFPHLLKGLSFMLPWKQIVLITSMLAAIGGSLMFILVPDGPFRKASRKFDVSILYKLFKNKDFRSAAFGYFGHMWELYAFWAFIPIILSHYLAIYPHAQFNIPILSFSIIGIGSLACVIAGYLAQKKGTKKIATLALLLSGLCCLASPLFFHIESSFIFMLCLIAWGLFVVADSPLFSTLVAKHAPAEAKGSALTLVNCIGFAITIVSIQLLSLLQTYLDTQYLYMILALGPILGLLALRDPKS